MKKQQTIDELHIRCVCLGGYQTVKSMGQYVFQMIGINTYTGSQSISRYRKRYDCLRRCIKKARVSGEAYYEYWFDTNEPITKEEIDALPWSIGEAIMINLRRQGKLITN